MVTDKCLDAMHSLYLLYLGLESHGASITFYGTEIFKGKRPQGSRIDKILDLAVFRDPFNSPRHVYGREFEPASGPHPGSGKDCRKGCRQYLFKECRSPAAAHAYMKSLRRTCGDTLAAQGTVYRIYLSFFPCIHIDMVRTLYRTPVAMYAPAAVFHYMKYLQFRL